jgi:hypothetical protein
MCLFPLAGDRRRATAHRSTGRPDGGGDRRGDRPRDTGRRGARRRGGLPRSDQLPLALAQLPNQQVARISCEKFDADADRLAESLAGEPLPVPAVLATFAVPAGKYSDAKPGRK